MVVKQVAVIAAVLPGTSTILSPAAFTSTIGVSVWAAATSWAKILSAFTVNSPTLASDLRLLDA